MNIKIVSFWYAFFAFYVFILLGNISRLIPIPFIDNNIPFTEIVLYIIGIVLSLKLVKYLKKEYLYITLFFSFLIANFIYGSIINGFEVLPLLYSIRLILTILSTITIGFAFYIKYGHRSFNFFDKILSMYMIVVTVSSLLFVAFPDSNQLWNFLASFGILFDGDPHQRRFISIYFDPNYYGAIAVIPAIFSLNNFKKTQNNKYLVYLCIIIVSIILTVSRSGVATLILYFGYEGFIWFKTLLLSKKIQRKSIYYSIFGLVIVIVLYILFNDNILRLVERVATTTSDTSAYARFTSYIFGMEIIYEYPLMGIGYNYLSEIARSTRGLTSVDSSIQAMVINFGIIGFLIFASIIVKITTKISKKSSTGYEKSMMKSLNIYLFVIILFTSNFNNLLFYQFWLIPMMVIYAYLYFNSVNQKKYVLKIRRYNERYTF